MRRVACLHTADSNIPIFDAAADGLDLSLRHMVRSDLLAAAEKAGGLTPEITAATEIALRQVSDGAEIVLLTCSILGPVADRLRLSMPVKRIDRALAEAARDEAKGGRIAVIYTFPGTRLATETLFREVVGDAAEMHLVADAWGIFKAGERDRYMQMIADAADGAGAKGAASIAFAQASMAPAAALCRAVKPLTSPRASLAAAASI